MQVAYDLRPSTIAGLGLFAVARITKGALIWKFSNESVRTYASADEVRAALATKSAEQAAFFLEHAYCWGDKVCEILDEAYYWNHSKSPNTGSLPDDEHSSWALRDIEAGEELLDDYSQHDTLPWFEAICAEHAVYSSSAVGAQYE